MDGDKTEGAVESKSVSRRPMDIWISVFGTERLLDSRRLQSISIGPLEGTVARCV